MHLERKRHCHERSGNAVTRQSKTRESGHVGALGHVRSGPKADIPADRTLPVAASLTWVNVAGERMR